MSSRAAIRSLRVPARIVAGTILSAVLAAPSARGGAPAERPTQPAVKNAVCGSVAALTPTEVDAVVRAAAAAVASNAMTVAVVDRAGNVLAVFRKPSASPADGDHAVGLARTAAFFSADQVPLSSRTVRFISGIHFPPAIDNTASAPLYGIENTNRGCDLNATFNPGKAVPPARSLAGGPCKGVLKAGCGSGPVTGKADPFDSVASAVDPGGVPLYRAGSSVVGGVGVAGVAPPEAEFSALSGAAGGGFLPAPAPPATVFLGGIRLPFVEQRSLPGGSSSGTASGSYAVAPQPGSCVPDGYLVGPSAGSQLSASQVDQIVQQAIAAAGRTRSALRLPLGSRTRMVIAVGDLDGRLLALYHMPDAPVFSIDVAVAKARNVVYLSAGTAPALADLPGVPAGTAVSNRTIGFAAQPLYPSGIDGTAPGPFFNLFLNDRQLPCTQGSQPLGPNQNGIVFFPGSLPLYHGSTLVGGLGVSGDGVDQDDYIAFQGAQSALPPRDRWADQVFVNGVRLPFLKFPRNPEQ
jgi:uncharacterized protein GlcG (DUF336 family)